MNEDTAIKVEHVYKDFKLVQDKADTLKSAFVSIFQSKNHETKTLQALKDINLEIKKGEFFGVVGRNGSGKSTLLKILANIYQPSSGKVYAQGKLVPFIELGVGFNPELSGKENVYLNGAMFGFSKSQVAKMYEDVVSFAELERFMDQKLKNYSSGMQVRLAFSMATRSNADILLIDEVLAVGDGAFQRKCYDYFKKLKREGKTVVFVSHDMSAIREFCDSVALVESGEIKAVGKAVVIGDKYNQLFSKDLAKIESLESNRWGDKSVVIKSIKLNGNVFTKKDKILKLSLELMSNVDTREIMTGFRVINSAGQCLHETNTWNEAVRMPTLKKEQTCGFTWQFPNIYVDGTYTIDAYAYSKGEVADSWNNALSFRSNNPEYKGFLVIPPITGRVEKFGS